MDKVLVLFKTEPDFCQELSEVLAGYDIIFNEALDTEAIDLKTASETVAILGNPNVNFIKVCPRLKWLQLQTAGADSYVNGELDEKVLLCCASGGYGHAVSEHMTALTFALIKKIHLYRDEQSAGRWQNRGMVKSIQGAVVLVIGLGDIGSCYARRMKAMGAYVIGVRRTEHAKPDYVDELIVSQQMEKALPRADVVALSVPGTKDTAGLIGKPQLAMMKRDAVIINAGRGTAIDTEALSDALESGALGGAGLDVFNPEPLPPEHRLWKQENALITPHVAGFRYMRETGQYVMKINLENARRFVQGEKLVCLVDYKTGYKMGTDLI